jgi:hypothetical protein
MTPYHFKQAVKIDGQHFKPGIHHVAPEVEAHPHFMRYVECGWVSEASQAEVVAKPESAHDRARRLHEKLMAKPATNHVEKQEVAPEEEADDAAEETPAQKAARTRKANAEKAKAGKGE